jgi:hypothetical protein
MYRASVFLILAMAVLIPLAAAQTAPAPPAQAPGAQTPAEEAPPVLAVPRGYKYDPRGRRDPFVNPVPKPAPPEPAIPVIRPPGLRGVLMSEANLTGVVTSRESSMNRVVIAAPGGRTYFAAPGDALFDAIVKEIRPDSVVFTLTPQGGNRGQQQPANREVVRRVNPVPGVNQ